MFRVQLSDNVGLIVFKTPLQVPDLLVRVEVSTFSIAICFIEIAAKAGCDKQTRNLLLPFGRFGEGTQNAFRHVVFEVGDILVRAAESFGLVSSVLSLLQTDRFLAQHELVLRDLFDLFPLVERAKFIAVFGEGRAKVGMGRLFHEDSLSDLLWAKGLFELLLEGQRVVTGIRGCAFVDLVASCLVGAPVA